MRSKKQGQATNRDRSWGPLINQVVRIVLRGGDRTTPSRKCRKLAQRESPSQSRGSYGSSSSLSSSARDASRISPHFLNRSDSDGSVFRWIVGLGKNCQ